MLNFLLAIAAAVVNEEIGNETIVKWIDTAISAIRGGRLVNEQLEVLSQQIRTMVEEDRNPTDDEWQDLRSRSDAAHSTIQEADLSDPETAEETDDPNSQAGSSGTSSPSDDGGSSGDNSQN